MKKTIFILLVLMSVLTFFTACGGNNGMSGSKENLLKYVPEDVAGYMLVDVNALSTLEIFNDLEKDFKSAEGYKKYNEFVAKTGIDPKKDIKGLAVGIYDANFMKTKDVGFVAIAAVKYDKGKLLASAKEKGGKFIEEDYEGTTLYNVNENGKTVSIVFVDSNHIIFANQNTVKKAVDLFKGKGKSILQNDKKNSYMKMINDKAMFSMVFDFPEALKTKKNVGMGVLDFTKAECFIGSVWRGNGSYEADIKIISKNKEGNEKIVQMLNMFKGFGAAQPDYKELIDGINITSDADMIKITVSISDIFIDRMKDKAKSVMKGTDTKSVQ